ncbi:hypothetical protein [Mycobacteroides saopaulense]|uniref:hypothetical protein n=1 Tax=Mycobacteroides saopaulense TaxID=1578165 RepID=UPI000B4D6F37|nr:hypothetical protein [Mycobacteroides saopaulense]
MSQPEPGPGVSGGHAVLGAFLFAVVNAVVAVVAFVVALSVSDKSSNSGDAVFIAFAVVSLLAAFGGGAALMRTGDRDKRGLGLGLMIGWALVTLLTGGVCTGAGAFLGWIPGL